MLRERGEEESKGLGLFWPPFSIQTTNTALEGHFDVRFSPSYIHIVYLNDDRFHT